MPISVTLLSMDIAQKYDHAAPLWGQKVTQLGYTAAYDGFLSGQVAETGAVLDVGTGTGAFARSWIRQGGSPAMTLLDPSPAMLAMARRSLATHGLTPWTICAPMEHLPQDARYDAILGAHVLEHFDPAQDGFQRLAHHLAPGGRLYLVISKPHWCNWLIWLRYRHRWYAPGRIEVMARQAGLIPMRTHRFHAGPPSRTSLGYIFTKPERS
ncbi:class I SAM-dependent methyltransferase [Pontivivens insulae]|uniref:Ubiquinone/menaquinone biosynthesis C-methyltransferase UbiE n=1 Tax=Pontivivens insulae TaxID=1639689 RepID=A0A2R8A7U7_9RHOB|nr:class I SAM-dependent methyltransferase [Pontivivens insulae]RED18406.1 methyltransferase family protein [Pontivivens insulae]SPF28304.1 Ubiquinone/menaquinone biosynthesis C-methyltransferase UbiE [Pontivivens insulae]